MVIKKIKLELIVLVCLFLSIFLSTNLDLGLYNKFNGLQNSLNNLYFKKFFIDITVLGDSLWFFVLSVFLFFLSLFLNQNYKFLIP